MMGSEMGLLISPTEHANLWSSEFKIHRLGNFKCSCSIRGEMWSSRDALWRLRPEFSLSVRLHRKQYRRIMGINSWMRFHAKRSAIHTLGLSMEEAYLPLQPFLLCPARDNEKIPKCFKSDSLESKQFLSHLKVQSELCNTDMDTANDRGSDFNRKSFERDQPVEEPWLLQAPLLSHYAANSNFSPCLTDEERIVQHHNSDPLETKSSDQSILKFQPSSKSVDTLISITKKYDPYRTFCDSNQPVEEPWLFESRLFLGSDAKVTSKEYIEDEATHSKDYDQQHQVTEILLPEEESNSIYQDDSVSKVILINSSVCTMQRIAVLEDGKLVELLLEPVKNNVQSNSVYLGVVSKLVPNMDGAMVDIGTPRSALLRLYHNREPFLFPPFRRCTKEKKVNGHVFSIPDEQRGADEFQANSHDVEGVDEAEEDDIDDDSVRYLHDEYAEHDSEDDDDIREVVKGNVNGSLPGHGEIEAVVPRCSDRLDGRMDNVEGFFDNSLPSQLQDMLKTIKEGKKWAQVCEGTKIIVQVVKEGLGTKGPTVTAYPSLKSRFWVLMTRSNRIGISNKISGLERTRLRVLATKWQRQGFGLTVRTVAAGRSEDELQKDLDGLLLTWNDIMEHAKSAVLAADEGMEGAIPVMLHRAMGQTLSVVQDYFSEKVKCMVVDSPRTYHEVTNYLQEIAPDLCDRVELYNDRTPLFDKYNIEEEMSNILCKRVPLANGGYLVIEQTEALVSIDVNGGQCMLGEGTSKEKAILEVNLAAAQQIARELRLRDIGGIIVVDFIDMEDDTNKRLVYEEAKKAVGRTRSTVRVSELSRNGLMEITRKRVRPSVTFMITEPCTCCHATGRVEALETSFSKIEREICRLLAMINQKADPGKPTSWPRFILQVDRQMCNYLTSGKPTRLAVLSSSLKVWILLKVARGFSRGVFDVKPLTNGKDSKSQPQVPVSMLRRPTKVGAYTPREKLTIFPIKKRRT